MASVVREFTVAVPADKAWSIIGDFAHGPIKLASGIFAGCEMLEDNTRQLTFSDGVTAKEQLISRDDTLRRGVWRWVDENVEHDNTVMQVFPEGDDSCRVVWIHDVLPDSAAEWLAPTMDKLIPLFQESIEKA
jgi:hypothetical protein